MYYKIITRKVMDGDFFRKKILSLIKTSESCKNLSTYTKHTVIIVELIYLQIEGACCLLLLSENFP